jgi:rRNA-processing protein FCF1
MLLKPGKSYDDAIRLLDDITQGSLNDVANGIPHIGSASFQQMMTPAVLRYENWTVSAQKRLRQVFVDSAIIERLRAEKYWIIVGSPPAVARTASMIHGEINELRSYFLDLANDLRERKARFAKAPSLVLDTNDLLHYYRLDNIPWATHFGKGTRVMLPHVVVDEIDSKSYSAGPSIQKRSRGVYRMLEKLLDKSNSDGLVTLNDGTEFEILADEIGHVRLTNNDDEIIRSAAILQQASHPHEVTVVTRDIGMRARALTQRLRVAKIPDKYLIREEGLAAADLATAVASITEPGTNERDGR